MRFDKKFIIHKSKDKLKKIKFNKKTLDQTYVNQHKNILLDKKIACTYQEALNVIKFIDKIKNENDLIAIVLTFKGKLNDNFFKIKNI